MKRFIVYITWAWMIIIGGLLIITPGGVQCLACGPTTSKWLGVISILIGVAAFFSGRSRSVGG